MASHEVPDRLSAAGQPDREVEITVIPDPNARPVWERVRAGRPVLGLGAAVVLLASIGVIALGGPTGAHRVVVGSSALPGPAAVAAALGYPPHCLTVVMPARASIYARVNFTCGGRFGHAAPIFLRMDGRWRPVLEGLCGGASRRSSGVYCAVGPRPH